MAFLYGLHAVRGDSVMNIIFNSVNLQTVSRVAVYSVVDAAAGHIGKPIAALNMYPVLYGTSGNTNSDISDGSGKSRVILKVFHLGKPAVRLGSYPVIYI